MGEMGRVADGKVGEMGRVTDGRDGEGGRWERWGG